jgi:hypothetical protein
MSKKAVYSALAAILILSTGTVLIVGPGWCHRSSSANDLHLRRGAEGERGEGTLASRNVKVHALTGDFGKVPVYFVPNGGQVDEEVAFYIEGAEKTVFFTADGLTLALNSPKKSKGFGPERWVVKLDFFGAAKGVTPEGLEKTGAVISYFRGKPEDWKAGLPTYSSIIYRDLWAGIDLIYRGELDRLKYEFVVHPGADPSKIRLAYQGAERVALTEEGRLKMTTPAGTFEDDIPVAYQEDGSRRTAASVAYSLEGVPAIRGSVVVSGSGVTSEDGLENQTQIYSFEVGDYDRSRALVIDPAVLVYCGYIGDSGCGDVAFNVAVDGAGNAYVTGRTGGNPGFPLAVGPDLTPNGDFDVFVAKLNATGTSFTYCGLIGGTGWDEAYAISVDGEGNAYITGMTHSSEATFPVLVGPCLTQGGDMDAFVAKVNASGTALVYCGYVGGADRDEGTGIAVETSGHAYVTGRTASTESSFPISVGPDLTSNGGYDAFVAKVHPSGNSLVYCGYIGGLNNEEGGGIAVDGSGSAYVSGQTSSSEASFPIKSGPDLTYNGREDAWAAKINSLGSDVDYCGYIGGSGSDSSRAIAVDSAGNAYLSGFTDSTQTTFPVKTGPDLTYGGGESDAFVAKIDALGAMLIFCGYIGGGGQDNGEGIAVDGTGNVYLTGSVNQNTPTFPVVDGPDLTYNGFFDGFIAEVDSLGTSFVYCGYVGGADADYGHGIAVDRWGNAIVAGHTTSTQATFPVVAGPDLTMNGSWAGFVARVSPANVMGPALTLLVPDSADAGNPGFILSVIGSDFVDGAVVRWDGSPRPTTFISGTEVQATVDPADLAAGMAVQVTVLNPDGGVSNTLPFSIHNPGPSLTSISPAQATGGGVAFTLTVLGSSFVPNSVVRWNGSDRVTTFVSATELQAAITATDIATGGDAQITVFNPAPVGGASGALALQVSSFTLSASTTSVTVTAGQSATYTIQLTPQHGSFDSAVTFSCAGLPSKCAASFAPASATPGAAAISTTLTLTTAATSSSTGATGATLFGTTGFGPPIAGLFAIAVILLLTSAARRHVSWRLSRRRLAACALVCLIIVIGSCSSGGDDNNPPPYTGTPKGTHTISVQATSGNMTVPTSITLVVN